MKTFKKIYMLIVFILITSLIVSGCSSNESGIDEAGNDDGKITIYTSIYPLYDFASKIAGDNAKVVNLVPAGTEPHDFEPTPKDLVKVSEADIFIYNGGGFESWIEDVLDSIDTSNMVVLNISDHLDLLTIEETEAENSHNHGGEHADEHSEEEHSEEGHSEHEGEGLDPHTWLDPVRALQIAEEIKEALIQADQTGSDMYESNFTMLQTELNRLHEEYETALKNRGRDEFIVSHSAFGYLANRYGLQQVAISGITPSHEPSQRELQEIIAFAKEHDVKYILFETLVSGKVADVVKNQIGAEALTLNTLEGLTKEELSEGKDYFSVMRENLESLKTALGQ